MATAKPQVDFYVMPQVGSAGSSEDNWPYTVISSNQLLGIKAQKTQ